MSVEISMTIGHNYTPFIYISEQLVWGHFQYLNQQIEESAHQQIVRISHQAIEESAQQQIEESAHQQIVRISHQPIEESAHQQIEESAHQ